MIGHSNTAFERTFEVMGSDTFISYIATSYSSFVESPEGTDSQQSLTLSGEQSP